MTIKRPNLHGLDGVSYPAQAKAASLIEDENVHQRYTQDVYAQSCAITAWQQLYDQIHPGHFRGELTELRVDGIQFCHEYTNLALRQSCMVWPDAFWLGIPAAQSAAGFIGSQPIDERSIALSPGGKEFELSTPNEYAILGVVISYDALFRHNGMPADQERFRHLLHQPSALMVEPHQKAALWSLVRQALYYGCRDPQWMQNRHAGKMLNDSLLTMVMALLESADPLPPRTTNRRMGYRQLVSRAREYVIEQTSEPVTVPDLCRELYVSRRTLQNAFCEVLGVGPNAWLKMIRLNAVRRELISPFSRSHTVKDAAMQWGFWHLSQFANDYQRLFNEKPSATLRMRAYH
ncbi:MULTISPECIES: HTH-type transcriptional regulator EutR [Brenneria]|uniref:HTH-type transcriptional regulator EutR n=1 Tax=Brenneria nigrifluens DSM 30175 = ATCC 13028 TaxID=1121120 RepID=A0A2U1UQV2_9GAMM|nr:MULTISPECIES: HTH-type transcriptional regulator EutR [Brenneria]EHD22234.1 transcriptional regulator, AraC family [Brenneria sp. EniD312]PWC24065.1 HTH-type transcriptional regulator EutR [Brenneria nigrifluens DSM 30175 = ATCC 13028]QCR05258.1 HTH-type transcriptional regulator EutR [Brenneria nigrifluens DSM 30175 = ATCC 13028]